jgi:hypothetical protein
LKSPRRGREKEDRRRTKAIRPSPTSGRWPRRLQVMRNIAYRWPSWRLGSTHHDRDVNGANRRTLLGLPTRSGRSRCLTDRRRCNTCNRIRNMAVTPPSPVTDSVTPPVTPAVSARVTVVADCRSRTGSCATRVTGSVTGSVTAVTPRSP